MKKTLIDIYTNLFKNQKLLDENNVREKGIPLRKIRRLNFIQKLSEVEKMNRIHLVSVIYGNKYEDRI